MRLLLNVFCLFFSLLFFFLLCRWCSFCLFYAIKIPKQNRTGANIDVPQNDGRTPIHLGSAGGHVAVVEALISRRTLCVFVIRIPRLFYYYYTVRASVGLSVCPAVFRCDENYLNGRRVVCTQNTHLRRGGCTSSRNNKRTAAAARCSMLWTHRRCGVVVARRCCLRGLCVAFCVLSARTCFFPCFALCWPGTLFCPQFFLPFPLRPLRTGNKTCCVSA